MTLPDGDSEAFSSAPAAQSSLQSGSGGDAMSLRPRHLCALRLAPPGLNKPPFVTSDSVLTATAANTLVQIIILDGVGGLKTLNIDHDHDKKLTL